MGFKANLTKHFNKQISEFKKSLEILEKTDEQNANYVVYLHSLWENEGGKSTTTKHLGTLEEAIKKAEAKFKKVNGGDDLQADYVVSICLDKNEYGIPERYWKRFQEPSED